MNINSLQSVDAVLKKVQSIISQEALTKEQRIEKATALAKTIIEFNASLFDLHPIQANFYSGLFNARLKAFSK